MHGNNLASHKFLWKQEQQHCYHCNRLVLQPEEREQEEQDGALAKLGGSPMDSMSHGNVPPLPVSPLSTGEDVPNPSLCSYKGPRLPAGRSHQGPSLVSPPH